MKVLYPNIKITFWIFIKTQAINCTAEHPFSVLKRIKKYIVIKTRFFDYINHIIESNLMPFKYEDIIDHLSRMKSGKNQRKQ